LNSNYNNDENENDNNNNNIIQYNENNIIHYTEINNKINFNYIDIIDSKEDEPYGNVAEIKGDEPDGSIVEMKGDEPDENNTFHLSMKPSDKSVDDIFESDHDNTFNYTGSLYSDCDSECEYCEDRKKYDRR
jgi:hypothetical protein